MHLRFDEVQLSARSRQVPVGRPASRYHRCERRCPSNIWPVKPDRAATPARPWRRAPADNSQGGGRPREIPRGHRAGAPARCPRRPRGTRRAARSPARRRRCRSSSRRASPRPLPRTRHRDREDLGLVRGAARHDEADGLAPARGAIRDHAAVGEQLLEFLLAPAAIERSRMQRGERGRVARMRCAEHRLGAAEQAGEQRLHRRGSRPASCGRASGRRR